MSFFAGSDGGVLLMVLVIGMCVGSFLNVCIYRIPGSQSIVTPASSCPHCRKPIQWYDNIPVLSYFLLRGRCRNCRESISLRYPLVETITGAMAVSICLIWGLSVVALVHFTFICALITITFIDIDHQIIPDVITIPGMLLGLGAVWVFQAVRLDTAIVYPEMGGLIFPDLSFADSVIGFLAGGGILLAVAIGYEVVTGREGMGGGDIKLLAMVGTLVGWKGVVFTIFSASLIGTAVGLAVMIRAGRNMKLAIPFGPFLSIGAILYLFWGPDVLRWYLSGLGG